VWIADRYNVDVIALAVDVGEEKNYEAIRRKGEQVGAVESIVVDAKQEFFDDFITRAIAANLMYEHKYPAFTALARPLLAKEQVRIAREKGATYVAHGCTGKGNDQVRFEVTYQALAPELKVIAPAREWNMSREEEIEYAERHGIPVPVGKESPYSTDTNLWGRSIECGVIEDPSQEAPEDAWQWTVSPAQAPDEPAYVQIEFEQGVPVALDGERLPGPELVARLNALGGAHGVGRVNMMENRLVGIKSRELYETPAAAILLAWYTPLREAIDAFMAETQKRVSGTVTMKLYKGRAEAVARESNWSLYDYSLATYAAEDQFDQSASVGFIHIWGLPAKVAAAVRRKQGG